MAERLEGARHGPRIAFTTLGCKVNRAESEAVIAELLGAGAELVDTSSADTVVVHTCCVTGEAERKVRKAVRRALRAGPASDVVVSGCLARIDPEGLAAIDERVRIVPDPRAVSTAVLGREPGAIATTRVGRGFRTRVLVKVQDGCDARCAYCVVPQARGAPWSEPLSDVVREVAGLVEEGVAEVVLSGVNMGRYDDRGADLADLVGAVAATGIERLRLSSIEPEDVTPRLLDELARTPSVCRHLHIPLQSGSDAVLSHMGRSYDTRGYREVIERARGALDGLAVTTDVIAGFPGESDAEHAETTAFLASLAGTMTKLHVFRYSPRPGTVAAAMPDRPSSRVVEARAGELRTLGASLREEYLRARVGGTASVLLERVEGESATGTTEDYIRVDLAGPELREGTILTARLTELDGLGMKGAC